MVRLMSRSAYIFFSIILMFTSSLSFAASAQVRVSIDTSKSYWVGQKIPFYVDLLSPGFFSGTPKFDLPEISGVLVMKIPERPVMGTEEIEGQSYTRQRHEFVLFSQRQGQVDIPSFTVRFGVSGQAGASPKEISLKTSPLTLTPKMPPGAEKLSVLISTRDLKVTERWSPEPKEAKQGDAFTRTITFQAPDIPGMAFAPLPEININGIGIYAETPVVNDRIERGDFIGERTETISYVMESSGKMTIPAMSFHWFDIASETLKTEELPEVTFKVSPSIAGPSSGQPSGAGSFKMIFIMGIVLLTFAGGVLWRWRRYLTAYIKSWQKYQAESESGYFKQLITACRKNEPQAVLNALMKWVDRVNPDRQAATLGGFVEIWGDPELASEVAGLHKFYFSQEKESGAGKKNKSWSGQKLEQLMVKVRKRLNKKRIQKELEGVLKPLNP